MSFQNPHTKTRRLVPFLAVICLLLLAGFGCHSPSLSESLIRFHPKAMPNQHAPGEVDRPELVPYIVSNPESLPGIVIDETEAILEGRWQYSTHTPPYVGYGYLHDLKSEKGRKSVTYNIELAKPGRYELRLSHCYNIRRSTNTLVTINHAGGIERMRINQQRIPEHGKLFRTLGIYELSPEQENWVRISNDGTDGKYVIADAVQLIPVR